MSHCSPFKILGQVIWRIRGKICQNCCVVCHQSNSILQCFAWPASVYHINIADSTMAVLLLLLILLLYLYRLTAIFPNEPRKGGIFIHVLLVVCKNCLRVVILQQNSLCCVCGKLLRACLVQWIFLSVLSLILCSLLSPRKRGIMLLPALVCLSVCLFVTTITK